MIARLFQLTFLALILVCLSAPVVMAQGLGELPTVTKKKSSASRKNPAATKPKSSSKTAPAAKPAPPPVNYLRDPVTIPPVSFNQAINGQLDPQTSGRITATNYYNEYKLTATTADLFTIQLETTDPSLNVQIYDSNQSGQPILKDPQTNEFKLSTPEGLLPADGDYHVRVLGTIAEEKAPAVSYTLHIKRSGLTEEGYETRLEQIVRAFNTPGGATPDETISRVEELIAIDPTRPKGYETLAVAYLYHRKDLARAVGLMEKAIKLGGAATFRVTHDSQWRKPERTGNGLDFPEPRTSWLSIRPDQATLVDIGNAERIYFSFGRRQIKDVDRVRSSPLITVRMQGRGAKQFLFRPVTRDVSEAEIIVNMIKSYVLKAN